MREFIKVSHPLVGEEEINAVADVLRTGNYVSGKKVEEFERAFSEYSGTKYAAAVSSGTAALHVILASLDIGPGDEVIVPAMTFFSTATSVFHQNAIPVFADVDDDYCIDPKSVKEKITDRTKAIIAVHLFGYACQMKELLDISKEHNLYLIEDCAQAHGTRYHNKTVGSIGIAGAFSFFATKNMTTGEGGMITTDNEEIYKLAKLIRSHGMHNRDEHIILGYNYRMTEMEAAMGLVQLKKLEGFNKKRREFSFYLYEHIKDIPWIHIQNLSPQIEHSFFWCTIRVDEDKLGMSVSDLVQKLKGAGIGVRQRYQEPLYRQSMLINKKIYPKNCPFECQSDRDYDYSEVFLPNAEKFAGKLIGLPNHQGLSFDELDYIIKTLKEIK